MQSGGRAERDQALEPDTSRPSCHSVPSGCWTGSAPEAARSSLNRLQSLSGAATCKVQAWAGQCSSELGALPGQRPADTEKFRKYMRSGGKPAWEGPLIAITHSAPGDFPLPGL